MLDALADWERYIEKDPILGRIGGATARLAKPRRSFQAARHRSEP
jgi:hypothetical protein